MPNPMYPLSSPSSFQSLYAQHWFVYFPHKLINIFLHRRRPPMFPFVFPPGYPFSPSVLSQGSPTAHTSTGHSSSAGGNHGNHSSVQKRPSTHR